MNYKKMGLALVVSLTIVSCTYAVSPRRALTLFNIEFNRAKTAMDLVEPLRDYIQTVEAAEIGEKRENVLRNNRIAQIERKFGADAAAELERALGFEEEEEGEEEEGEVEERRTPTPDVPKPPRRGDVPEMPEWAKKTSYTAGEANEAASVGGSLYTVADVLLEKEVWTEDDKRMGVLLIQKFNLAKNLVGELEEQKFVDFIEALQEKI